MDFAGGLFFERLVRVHHEDKQVIADQTQEITRTTNDTKIISDEGKTYAAAVAQANAEPDPAPAVVCVRRYALQVAAPPATRVGVDAGRGLPPGDREPVPASPAGTSDIAAPAAVIGARATAKVRG